MKTSFGDFYLSLKIGVMIFRDENKLKVKVRARRIGSGQSLLNVNQSTVLWLISVTQ